MAASNRPGAVTVIAVLNFVLGGLNLLGIVCGGGMLLLAYSLLQNAPKPKPGQPDPAELFTTLFTSIPGYIPFLIGSMIFSAIMSTLLIIAGFGLLKMKRWGRTLSLAYAVLTILATIGSTIYTFAVVQPAAAKWQAEFQAKMQKGAGGGPGAPAGPPAGLNTLSNSAGAVMGAIISIAYSIVILVVLNLPDVRRAFAGLPPLHDTDAEAARGWGDSSDRLPDQGQGRLRSDDNRFQGEEQR